MNTTQLDHPVDVIMQRDNMTREEAQELVDDTVEEIMIALQHDTFGAEQIWTDNTGLEPDYLLTVLI